MGIETKGFDELIRKLENMGTKSNAVAKKSVLRGAEMVLEQQKKDAPYDSNDSKQALDIGEVKKYKSGVYAKIGVTKDNWERTKPLYFQHYGYHNKGWNMKENPKLVVRHIGWMNRSFDKIKEEAKTMIVQDLQNVLKW